MAKRLSIATALIVICSLLFVSIVYACSGLSSTQPAFHASSMNGATTEKGPCSEHQQDICKSVRDRMLSIQPSSSQAADSQQSSTLLVQFFIGIPTQLVFSPVQQACEAALHPVFKLSLPFSLSVLRI